MELVYSCRLCSVLSEEESILLSSCGNHERGAKPSTYASRASYVVRVRVYRNHLIYSVPMIQYQERSTRVSLAQIPQRLHMQRHTQHTTQHVSCQDPQRRLPQTAAQAASNKNGCTNMRAQLNTGSSLVRVLDSPLPPLPHPLVTGTGRWWCYRRVIDSRSFSP